MDESKKISVVGLDAAFDASSYLTSFLHYSDFSAFPKEVHDLLLRSLADLHEEISIYESWHNEKE